MKDSQGFCVPGGMELAQARSGAEKAAQQHAAQASCKIAPRRDRDVGAQRRNP